MGNSTLGIHRNWDHVCKFDFGCFEFEKWFLGVIWWQLSTWALKNRSPLGAASPALSQPAGLGRPPRSL